MKTNVKNTNAMTINDLVNANAKAKRLDANMASKYFKHFKHNCLAIEAKLLQKTEKKAIYATALLKHNKLSEEERFNKAVVLCLNGLRGHKIPFQITQNEIKEALDIMSKNGDLEKCETKLNYNMEKLYKSLDKTVNRLRKLNKRK